MEQPKKIAIITGASTGIGKAVAYEFAKHNVVTYLVARSHEKLLKIQQNLGKENSVTFTTDLSDIGSINKLIKDIKEIGETDTDEISYLINIAGIWHGKDKAYSGIPFEDYIHQDVILDTLNVGIVAPMILCNTLIPEMANGSSIINLSGTFENGANGWLPYYVSKRAIEDFTVGLAEDTEVLNRKIKVNCVSPSDTNTEVYKRFFPEDAKNAQSPERVARFIYELTQKDVSGKVLVIKNGIVSQGFHK